MWKAQDLTVEYTNEPAGVDMPAPRFAWRLPANMGLDRQTAYRLLVASSPLLLEREQPDLWDSGKTESGASFQVRYAGAPLQSGRRYYWAVRLWDERDRPSVWSGTAQWDMGLLQAEDWKGEWITAPHSDKAAGAVNVEPAPCFRKEFELSDTPVRGMAYICGLGFYELYINGRKVGNRVLDPGATNYDHTVLYSVYDVTECFTGQAERAQAGMGAGTGSMVEGIGPGTSTVKGKDAGVEQVGTETVKAALTPAQKQARPAVGRHAVGVVLGRGRYALPTPNVWAWERPPWRDAPKLLLQLELEFADGRRQLVCSDRSWQAAPGPTLQDCLYCGELYDARRELGGWTEPWYAEEDGAAPVRMDADHADRRRSAPGRLLAGEGAESPGGQCSPEAPPAPDRMKRMWRPVRPADPPRGTLRAQLMPAIERIRTLPPISVTRLAEGRYVLDYGAMLSGWARLRITGSPGSQVRLVYGERCLEDGSVDVEQQLIHGQMQTDTYICMGNRVEQWEPSFSYKGFRYIEVDGLADPPATDAVLAVLVHTAVESVGEFRCSAELLNRIHESTRSSIATNLHSIPTDTPTYEKNGWTADAHLTAEAAIYNFDMAAFYAKWLADIGESQREDGELAPIVPSAGWGYVGADFGWDAVKGPVPAWDAALFIIPWQCWMHYGDKDILERHYPAMQRYLRYLERWEEKGILRRGLGDWMPPNGENNPQKGNPPEGSALASTAYYYEMARLMTEIAGVLERPDETGEYSRLAGRIREAFQRSFWSEERQYYVTEQYGGFRQASQLLPLAFGLVPEELREELLRKLVRHIEVERDTHLDTGILGTKYILPVLTEHGYGDLAYALATRTTYPGWGYWHQQGGAVSLWEAWETASRSRNHHMFGTIDDWFYQYAAGLRPLQPGWSRLQIKPYVSGQLKFVHARVKTASGTVESAWMREANRLELRISVPPNTTALVQVPYVGETCRYEEASGGEPRVSADAAEWTEGSETIPAGGANAVPGVSFVVRDEQGHRFEVRPGRYHFIQESGLLRVRQVNGLSDDQD